MPFPIGPVQERGAHVQVKWLILVLLDEFDGRRGRPFRVMSLERRLQVAPVDVLGPGEAAVLDELAVDLLVVGLVTVERLGVFSVLSWSWQLRWCW